MTLEVDSCGQTASSLGERAQPRPTLTQVKTRACTYSVINSAFCTVARQAWSHELLHIQGHVQAEKWGCREVVKDSREPASGELLLGACLWSGSNCSVCDLCHKHSNVSPHNP